MPDRLYKKMDRNNKKMVLISSARCIDRRCFFVINLLITKTINNVKIGKTTRKLMRCEVRLIMDKHLSFSFFSLNHQINRICNRHTLFFLFASSIMYPKMASISVGLPASMSFSIEDLFKAVFPTTSIQYSR